MGVVLSAHLLPFPPEIVGTYSCHGVEPGREYGVCTGKINQDRGCVCFPFGPDPEHVPYHQALFCVYDGHGACGDQISQFAVNRIQESLEQNDLLGSDPAEALRRTFVSVDRALLKDPSVESELSGTTAVVMLVRWAKNQGKMKRAELWLANVGDSRAVLARRSSSRNLTGVELTCDQKPDLAGEEKRILEAGGFVSPPEEEWGGPARVWVDREMTLPGLAMSRSIGDHLIAKYGVIAEPEVTHFNVKCGNGEVGEDLFIVMASDGVWEFIESQTAINIVADMCSGASATASCTRLIETAASKWRDEEGDYRDDITAICVKLPELLVHPDLDL